jgi:hypothetical protein
MSAKSHKDVEFAVDVGNKQQIFNTFNEAAGFAVSLAASGRRTHIDVFIFSRSGAKWYGGSDAAIEYDEDPDASVFERLEIRVSNEGRVA